MSMVSGLKKLTELFYDTIKQKNHRKPDLSTTTGGDISPFWPSVVYLCRDAESDCGHCDFQSHALPTELSRHLIPL